MSTFSANEKWPSDSNKKVQDLAKKLSPSRLYLDFYNLHQPPFSITPDPEFLYFSSAHKSVIENILYGIEARMGFLLLIGEVGTGKTTLCRAILDKLDKKAETVYIINPSLSGMEIILSVLDDLGIEYPSNASKKTLLDLLNRFLLNLPEEKPVIILIDDAQTMTLDGLENLRLLSNLETDKKKLLQLVLVGQQELLQILSRPELRQLKQRIAICCQLDRITNTELQSYISHRLFVAGDKGQIHFSPRAIRKIFNASLGIPRLINIICDYTLTAGYVSNSPKIRKTHAEKAIDEVMHPSVIGRSKFASVLSAPFDKRVWLELCILGVSILLLAVTHMKIFNGTTTIGSNNRTDITQYPLSIPPDSKSVMTFENVNDDLSTITKESPIVPTNDLTPAEAPKTNNTEMPQNYIIQLASLRNIKRAMEEVTDLREKGIDSHWTSVYMANEDLWYRVYATGFSTKQAAGVFKKEKGFSEGIIIFAPWTLLISRINESGTSENTCSKLLEIGYDCVLAGDENTGYEITIGSFKNSERALKTAQEIMQLGFDVKVIRR
jgi:type II secretory pathway predicted ATPase ExeA